MIVAGDNISGMYVNLCKALQENGETVEARGLTTRELTNVQLQLSDPRNRFVNVSDRDMDMRYCIGELCFFLAGRIDLSSIAHYSKFWKMVSDDGMIVNSAYGERLFYRENKHCYRQFDYAIDNLIQDPSTRKAVMPIYTPEDARPSNDNPCTMFVQLLIRDNRLHAYTYMRSNDVWLGVPYDVAFFTLLQEMAFVLLRRHYPELKLGFYFHNVTSMHMYERNYDGVFKITKNGLMNTKHAYKAPELTDTDLSTWFNDLLTYEKAYRGVVLYKSSGPRTQFQDWCKTFLI